LFEEASEGVEANHGRAAYGSQALRLSTEIGGAGNPTSISERPRHDRDDSEFVADHRSLELPSTEQPLLGEQGTLDHPISDSYDSSAMRSEIPCAVSQAVLDGEIEPGMKTEFSVIGTAATLGHMGILVRDVLDVLKHGESQNGETSLHGTDFENGEGNLKCSRLPPVPQGKMAEEQLIENKPPEVQGTGADATDASFGRGKTLDRDLNFDWSQ